MRAFLNLQSPLSCLSPASDVYAKIYYLPLSMELWGRLLKITVFLKQSDDIISQKRVTMHFSPVTCFSLATPVTEVSGQPALDLTDKFKTLNAALLEKYPLLQKNVQKNQDPKLLFQALITDIHARLQLKLETLEWEVEHIEELAEVDQFIKDLEKGDPAQLERQAAPMLLLFARFSPLKIPLERLKRFDTPHLSLLANIQTTPQLTFQIETGTLTVDTATYAPYLERVEKELDFDLSEFSVQDLNLATQFFKNPQKNPIPVEYAWRLLHLADRLLAPQLISACEEKMKEYFTLLDPDKAEEIALFLQNPQLEQHPELLSFMQAQLSAFIQKGRMDPHLRKLFEEGALDRLQILIDLLGPDAFLDLSHLRLKEKDYALLSALKNLQKLDLSGTDITSKHLLFLPDSIIKLNLGSCLSLTDLNPLGRLKRLEKLQLTGTILSGLPKPTFSLAGLPRAIKELDLSFADLTNFAAISHLDQLKKLNLASTSVTEEDLAALPISIRELDLSFTKFVHGWALSRLIHLKKLVLKGATISLSMIPLKIKKLDLSYATFTNFEKLSSCRQLETLDLESTAVTTEDLRALPKSVKSLYLGLCQNIAHFGPLKNSNIEILWVPYTKMSNIHLLGLPISLRKLYFAGKNHITDFTLLGRLPNLTSLQFYGTKSVSNRDLASFPVTLTKLVLASCRGLTNFTPLKRYGSLKTLYLTDTRILTLVTLPPSIEKLALKRCSVSNLQPLSRLPLKNLSLSHLRDQDIDHLPPSLAQFHCSKMSADAKTQLEARGVILVQ